MPPSQFKGTTEELIRNIQSNARRYLDLFATAIDAVLAEEPTLIELIPQIAHEDVVDVLVKHRLKNAQESMTSAGADDVQESQVKTLFPARLLRRYEVCFQPVSGMKAVPVRDVKAGDIGHLVKVRGICTRVSDVKPMVTVATYTCDVCGWEIYQEVNSKQFTPINKCPTAECQATSAGGALHMQSRGSKFVKYQEVRIQELPDQVPVGHIPRSITVVTRGQLTRLVIPGDVVTIGGIFVPTPYTGWQAMRAGLIADTYLDAQFIQQSKRGGRGLDALDSISPEMEAAVVAAAEDEDIYSKMARSLAPEIWGMEDVKKALLLQLVGGVTSKQEDGMRIRGDINILLLGDPGVAKSQLLKHVSKVAPRCVYTTGKGSSGVGLTAAILKDPVTGEMALEGGALVLADMGIACIDEFDKMEESDRTAIHEVMEQQTVSIAKAGITTTLNARTAILAAANPLYGRFKRVDKDPHLNMLKNINIPPALLSRFDLLFVLKDEPSTDNDMALARHVTYVHQHSEHPPLDFEPLSATLLRAYIANAQMMEPAVPPGLAGHIINSYVEMRADDLEASRATGGRGSLTPRQLLSILRLSQGLARLRFREEVAEEDVDEAIRLIQVSKARLMSPEEAAAAAGGSWKDRVWSIINEMLNESVQADGSMQLSMQDINRRVTRHGFSDKQLLQTIQDYADLGVVELNPSKTLLTITGT